MSSYGPVRVQGLRLCDHPMMELRCVGLCHYCSDAVTALVTDPVTLLWRTVCHILPAATLYISWSLCLLTVLLSHT